ncbi:hypothetical protein ACQP2F_27655 [Actinoplanes sp. CA-030573]|uniref:hypothetical protein n=1 Tax=Actinoplanes sp. CA-030573 TaxID=3239898 RepID=UPI003D9462E6
MRVAVRHADKATLAGALLTWWFVLRPDAEVVNAVDTVSYLVMVYSIWRACRSFAVRPRSERLWVRRREVAEARKDGRDRAVAEVSSESPEGVRESGVIGDEHVRRP